MVAAGGEEVDIRDDLWLGNELGVKGDEDRICPVSGDLADGILVAVSPMETIRGDAAFVIAASIESEGK